MNFYFQRLTLLAVMACGATAFLLAPVVAQFPPAPGTGIGLPETIEAIESARITTRILYVTAHPDDAARAGRTTSAPNKHRNWD